MVRPLPFLVFSLLCGTALAQPVNISGRVGDNAGGPLISAQVVLYPDSSRVLTDHEGNFVFTTLTGLKRINVSFVGFETRVISFNLHGDTTIAVSMTQKLNELAPVVVEEARDHLQEVFQGNGTSTNVLLKDEITGIPVLMGEADVIKTLQLLPGTVRGVEGSSDLFVRGGAADQNLVLLDGAPVYNTSHLFGFLSVFNPDILDEVEAINGGFPARYGGRLSSILNVNTRSRIPAKTHVSGDIGLISSRLFVEQPIVKDKASFWVAGRRTYIDRVVRMVGEELPYFFYDLNGKVMFHPDEKNRFELSHYAGEDILDLFRDRNNDGDGLLSTYGSGNNSQSFVWRRSLSPNVRGTFSAIRTRYRYHIRNAFEDNELVANSDIEDYSVRWLVTADSIRKGKVTAGMEWTGHTVSPNILNTKGMIAELLKSSASGGRVAHEFAAHAEYSRALSRRVEVAAGFRGSAGIVRDRQYFNPEPRLSARYALSADHAIKASYASMSQYIHRISNSAVTSPTDIWYPVTDSIRPQRSDQVALAWQFAPASTDYFVSLEGYYKAMRHLIGFEEGTNLFLNTEFESSLIQGRGRAYGVEMLVKKTRGNLTGWLSYSLTWSWRHFNSINNGEWFRSRYDRRHNGALVLQYAISRRLSTSLVWEYISGSRFTPVIGQYVAVAPTLTGIDVIPVFAPVNSVKLADTHRLDLGLKFRSREGRKFQWHWFAGLYNTYNRATPVGIIIEENEADGSLRYRQPGLFGVLPFISYGFKL